MALDDFDGETVADGRWLYGGAVEKPVSIVAFDRDFYWFHLPYADGERRIAPYTPNAEGRLFYVMADGELLARPFQSVDQALVWIAEQPWAPVSWSSS